MRRRVAAVLDRMPAAIARRFAPGSRAARVVRPALNRLLPGNPIPVTIRSGPAQGLRIAVDPLREKYYWTGTYEPHVQDALVRLLRPGMTFWDVGAHAGFFTFLAARLVGPDGSVLAVEPLAENRHRLQRGVELNAFSNIAVESFAVGGSVGTQQFHAHASTSMGSIVADADSPEAPSVRVRTLDDLGRSGSPDLVKIDVERAEIDVLTGGLELLAKGSKMIVELSGAREQQALERLLPPSRTAAFLGGKHWLVA